MTKVCIDCKKELPKTEFHLKSRLTGRLQGRCKPCSSAYMKNYIKTESLGMLGDDPEMIWGLLLYARRHQKPALRLVA